MSIEHGRLPRRDLLKAGAATVLLTACENSVLLQQDKDKSKEGHDSPKLGDVVKVGYDAFIRREIRDISLAFPIPDLPKFLVNIKHGAYGGKVWEQSSLGDFSLGTVPKEKRVFDQLGDQKDPKPLGGEINYFISGLLTENGVPYRELVPKDDVFIDIRKALESKKWNDPDSVFYSYGKRFFDRFQAQNTAIDPLENIKNALESFEDLKNDFPLVQFNLIAHSLGGIFALEVARKNPDCINNLILINSPVRGLNEGFFGIERAKLEKIKEIARGIFGELIPDWVDDEKVSEYLFKIWASKDYQSTLDEFGRSFTGSGKKLLVVASENDPFVPKESTKIKGADELTVSVESFDIFKPLTLLRAHGLPLKDERAIAAITERIGPNLAAA